MSKEKPLIKRDMRYETEENKVLKISLTKCQSSPEDSLLFVNLPRCISNFEVSNSINHEKQPPPSESTSSNGSEAGLENAQKRKMLPSDTLLDSANRLKSFFFDDGIFKQNGEDFFKTKILGIWHNMRYGWASNMRTNFSKETPICMFGKAYHRSFTTDNHECSNIEGFKRDFRSVFWFTYRQKFPVLEGTNLTSDCGWGCMIRSGQMMIATVLMRHILPRGWVYSVNNTVNEKEKHKKLISLFSDVPSPWCPFSIHNLVKLGNKLNKKAGNWYGPSCICHIFKDAFKEYAESIPELTNISVIICQDGGVYLQDIIEECSSEYCVCTADIGREALTKDKSSQEIKSSPHNSQNITINSACNKQTNSISISPISESDGTYNEKQKSPKNFSDLCTFNGSHGCPICEYWKPCIILVPMRLGRSSVNSLYYQCIFSLLLHDLCIGIIGGRPKHSLYFIGFQDKYLIHIDPHLIQDTISVDDKTFDFSSYHCSVPRKISISKMDPSSAVGFFCPTKADFIRLVKEVPQLVSTKEGNLDSSLFEFIDSKSPLQELELEDFECEMVDLSTMLASSIEDEELIC